MDYSCADSRVGCPCVLWNLLLTLFPAIRTELNAPAMLVLYNTQMHGYFMLREKGITSSFCNFLSLSVLEGLYPERLISSLVPRVKTTEDWRSEYHCCFAYCMTWEEERHFVCRVRCYLGTSFEAAVYSLQLIGLSMRWCDPPYVRLARAWPCIQPQSRWRG